jgi:hypothetical protein
MKWKDFFFLSGKEKLLKYVLKYLQNIAKEVLYLAFIGKKF